MEDALKIKNQWDGVYENFKENRISVWSEEASSFIKNKISFLKKQNVRTILDAGCGDGRNLIFLAKEGFNVEGIDISDSALKRCKKLCRGFGNVILKKGLIEERDISSQKLDTIICDHTLVHIKDIKKVIENFYNILKNEGYLLLEFTSKKDPLYGLGEKIGDDEFLQEGIYVRFFTINLIKHLLKKFKIISIDSESFTQPDHGKGYYRKERHLHNSFFVVAQKVNSEK